jgi:hypothetical protein
VSRSTDGGLSWGAPVTVAATGVFYDKNWTACDETSPNRYRPRSDLIDLARTALSLRVAVRALPMVPGRGSSS